MAIVEMLRKEGLSGATAVRGRDRRSERSAKQGGRAPAGQGFYAVPVVDAGGRLLGMVSANDLPTPGGMKVAIGLKRRPTWTTFGSSTNHSKSRGAECPK